MTLKNKKYLLEISRRAIEKYLTENAILVIDDDGLDKELVEKKATFVTLTINNELRGCMGEMKATKPLYQSVIDNSLASAFLDPRFNPLTLEELNKIKIEISILSPLKLIDLNQFKDINDFVKYLEKRKPGIFLKKDKYQATFLPQVWEELKNPSEFLTHLCYKAGLKPDEWLNFKNLEIQEYEVDKFKEA
ncbi:MAG: AmmeMemoRadiSam system protein A [Minisyncoccia bacterium]